jgi:hypothetical protein
MKTPILKKGVHKSGTYALYSELQNFPFVIYKQFSTFKDLSLVRDNAIVI